MKDGGPEILVSPQDNYLLEKTWVIGTNGYVYLRGARIKGMQCLLHRIILKAEKGLEV